MTYMNVTNDKLFKQVNHFTPVMSMFFIISRYELEMYFSARTGRNPESAISLSVSVGKHGCLFGCSMWNACNHETLYRLALIHRPVAIGLAFLG